MKNQANVVIKKACHCRGMLSMMTISINRHAELVSASSHYDTHKTLKQVQGDGRRGFTLIELLIVVLIIGILAAVAVPQYQKTVEKSRAAQALVLLKSAYQAAVVYYMEYGTYPVRFSDMDMDMPTWTGNKRWSSQPGVKDSRSNEDWSLQLYHTEHGGLNLYLGRISGKYAGAGFTVEVLDTQKIVQPGIIRCAERRTHGIAFSSDLNPGDYCVKIMGGRAHATNTTFRSYDLP